MVLQGEDAHAMQGHHNLHGAFLADVGQFHVSLKGDAAMTAQVVEQHLLALAVGNGVGVLVAAGRFLGAHDALMQPAGEDILVGHAIINVPHAIVIGCLDGLLDGLGDIGFDHRLAIDIKHLEGHVLLGAAVHLGRCLDHVDFLLAAHAGDVAIVLHTDEQMAAAVVGKGGYRAGYLAGIGNLVLEILMLVFALEDKVLYVVAFLSFHVFSIASRCMHRRNHLTKITMGANAPQIADCWGYRGLSTPGSWGMGVPSRTARR